MIRDEAPRPPRACPKRSAKSCSTPSHLGARRPLVAAAEALRAELGDGLFEDHNLFRDRVDAALDKRGVKLGAADLKLILRAVSWRVEGAAPVIAKVHKPGKTKTDPLRGLYEAKVQRQEPAVVEYEPDSDLRDTEQVPLLEPGGIEAFLPPGSAALHPRRLAGRDQDGRSATKSASPATSTNHPSSAPGRNQRRHPRAGAGNRGPAP
jgi:type I restriction enzyme M protein